MKTIKILSSMLIILVMIACSKKTEKSSSKKSISPPSQTLIKKGEELAILNPSDSSTIYLNSGTMLKIPSSSFVDANGIPVKKKVTLKYKEYKDAIDILSSGIPMEYDSAGIEQILQTAGMFELYGFDSKGKPVFIHPDKKITVNMLSTIQDPNYNFYIYDKSLNNWTYMDKSITTQFINKDAEIKYPKNKIPNPPIEPKKYDPKNMVIDMKIDTKEFPELTAMKGLMWQYKGDNPSQDPNTNKWIFATRWNNVKLTLLNAEKSLFTLNLSNSTTTFETTVTPVLSGKNLDKALKTYQEKFEAYNSKYSERIAKEKEEEKSRTMFYRTVGVGNFGIYNHDRVFKNDNPRIAAKFELESGDELEDATIYHLYGAAATVVRYPADKWNAFAFTKTGGNCLVAFLKNGKIAMFTNDDFKKLDENKIRTDKSVTFKMNSAPGIDIDAEAIRKMVKI